MGLGTSDIAKAVYEEVIRKWLGAQTA